MYIIVIIDKAISDCIAVAMNISHSQKLTNHICVSALVTKNDDIILGTNIPKSGIICAEMVALGATLVNYTIEDIISIITISLDDNGNPFILNMCGNCRQNFSFVCPHIRVVIGDIHQYREIHLSELLPYPYIRRK